MKTIPENVSAATRKRNPHLYGTGEPFVMPPKAKANGRTIRLRQSSKPKLNKLEEEFRYKLKYERPDDWLSEQAITFRLANGVRYTPDFVTFSSMNGEFNAYEVKGQRMWEDSGIKLKIAATAYPWIRWTLVWKERDNWKRQVIVP